MTGEADWTRIPDDDEVWAAPDKCAGVVDESIGELADIEKRTQDQVAKGSQIVPELHRQLEQTWSGHLVLE